MQTENHADTDGGRDLAEDGEEEAPLVCLLFVMSVYKFVDRTGAFEGDSAATALTLIAESLQAFI